MLWQISAIISVVFSSTASLLQRLLMKDDRSDPIGYAIIFQLLLGFASLLFAILFGKFVFPPITKMPMYFVISAVLWAAYTIFSFNAIKRLNAGEVTILISSSSLITIILGILLLHESMRIQLAIALLFVFGALLIVTTEKLNFSSRKGVIFALIASLCSGIAVVNDAVILKSYEAFSFMAIMSFLPGILLLMVFPKRINKIIPVLDIRFALTMILFSVIYSIQGITYYFAFTKGAPISQLAPITRASVVLTVILAAIFLKERSQLTRKFLAAILMTIGVVLLG